MQSDSFYWEYSFDLIDKEVQRFYGRSSYKRAWSDIGEYLIANGFDNKDDKQYSCYFTSRPMSPQRANAVIRKMFRELPWITLCLHKDSLTIRQGNIFSNKNYAERLNRSRQHLERLDEYYRRLDVPNPLK